MFDRLKSSWALLKASAAVLRADKHLIVFPIISAIASLFVSAAFFVPAALYAYSHHLFNVSENASRHSNEINMQLHSPLGYMAMFTFYVVQYTIVFFANTALVGAALIRLRGGQPTVGAGFALAASRMSAILGYALISSTVGMVIRAISERTGFVGRMGMGLFGLAWNVATYLVAPVLIAENVGPIEAIKRSANLLKRTWGEQIIGNAGLGTAFGLIVLLVIMLFVPLFIGAASMESAPLIITLVVLFVLAFTALLLIQAALTGIYTAAIYLYASENVGGGPFDPEMIHSAFRAK